jgi:anti-sigma regulatory factor (Ser/Thr protein kinase)
VVLACVAVLVTVTCAFPSQIVRLFIPQGHEGADALLRVYAIGFLPLAINYVLTYYYNTVQRRGIAMTLTVCENLLFYVPLVWACTHAWNLMGAMVAFVLTEVLALLTALLVADRVRRSQGLPDVLLVPADSPEIVYEATSVASSADGAAIAHRVNEVLLGQGVTKSLALQTAIAVEELVVCVHLNNAHQRHDVHFDTIVRNLDDSVQVSLRDNGTPFDPAHANEIAPKGTPEERETAMDGMAVLKSLATSVEYHYTLGLNHTVIQLSKGTDASPARDEHSEVDE